MAVTYLPGTNQIQVVGYSLATPCRWADVIAAEVAGGWGKITQQGNQFRSIARLLIGDGASDTYFYQENEDVELDALAASLSEYVQVNDKGNLQFGKDATANGTNYNKNGGSLAIRNGVGAAHNFKTYGTTSSLKMYGVRLQCLGSGNFTPAAGTTVEIKNSVIEFSSIIMRSALATVKDSSIFTSAINFEANPVVWDNVYLLSNLNGSGLYIQENAKTIKVVNGKVNDPASNKPYYFYLFGSTDTMFLDDSTGPAKYQIRVDGSITWDRKTWQPKIGYNIGGVFTPISGVALTLKDGYENTLFTGNSDANGQWNFSTILTTWGSGYDTTDTTKSWLVWRRFSYSGTPTNPTITDTYKNHVATFSKAGIRQLVYPFSADAARLNDAVVMELYTTPAVPVISTAETTVYEPIIDLSGTSTNATDISVSVEVGGVEKARVYPVAGAWSASIPLAVGANSVRAREKSDDGSTVSAYCGEKTFIYQQYVTPEVPVIEEDDSTTSDVIYWVTGTGQTTPDIVIEVYVDGGAGPELKETIHTDDEGVWATYIELVYGNNIISAKSFNVGSGERSDASNLVTITRADEDPVIPTINTVSETTSEEFILVEGGCVGHSGPVMYYIELQVNEETQAQAVTYFSSFAAMVPLVVGSNSIRAREVNSRNDDASDWSDSITIDCQPWVIPQIPTIVVYEETVYDNMITIEGICQDDNGIKVRINGGVVGSYLVEPVEGVWRADILLEEGINELKAQEVNGNNEVSAWSDSIEVSSIISTNPDVPIISTSGQNLVAPPILIEGTCTEAPIELDDIFISIWVNGEEKEIIKPSGGVWSIELPLTIGDNLVKAKEINSKGDESEFCGEKNFTYHPPIVDSDIQFSTEVDAVVNMEVNTQEFI